MRSLPERPTGLNTPLGAFVRTLYRWPYLLFLVVFGGMGCQSLPVTFDTASDEAYFPLEIGQYRIYKVSEQRFAGALPIASSSYQVKEVTDLRYRDTSGQIAYRIKRYHRLNETMPWQADSIWSARKTQTEALRSQNGKTIVILRFPIYERQTWNANKYHTTAIDTYENRNINSPFRVLGNTFTRTVTVIQQQDSTLLAQDKRSEVYAFDVGLIYRDLTHLQYCSSAPNCIGKAKIEYGIRQMYELLYYGKE